MDEPIFTEVPLAEIFLQLQLACRGVDERVEYLGLEVHQWHRLRIVWREGDAEFKDCILVDALFDEVDAFPVSQRRPNVVEDRRSRH